MQKFLTYSGLGILVSILTISLSLFFTDQFSVFDNQLRDSLFKNRGSITPTDGVVIIDIDERSLKEIGQFPWKRNIVATMTQNLSDAGAAAIGFDIMFPEPDKSSPHRIIEELDITDSVPVEKIINYDQTLADTVAKTRAVLGYTFDFSKNEIYLNKKAPNIPGGFIQRGKQHEYLLQPEGVITNLPAIQDGAFTSGFFTVTPDDDGVIRSVPLVIAYQNEIYPSIGLELLRTAAGIEQVDIHYDELGVRGVSMGGIDIPTDVHGRMAVNYRGPSFTYQYISAADIINKKFDTANIKDKIILIGTSATGLLDLRNIPFDSIYPGVEIHANFIDNILTGDFIHKPAEAEVMDYFMIALMSLTAALVIGYSGALLLPFVIVAIGFIFLYFINYLLFSEGLILSIFYPLLALILGSLVAVISNYFLETKQKNLIRGKFASKVSPQVMEDIINNADKGENAFIAKEHEISVTFSDVRNFTNISEAAGDAHTLIQFLNEYMDDMTKIIMKYEGTVDKFIGDAIMSYWNAPALVENHVEKAVDATLDQIHAVEPLNVKVKNDPRFANICSMAEGMGVEPIEIGIGINVGVATVGEMGSSGRSDYTAIGDPINLGARLEALCKFYNSMCNISNHVKARIPEDKYIYRFLDLVTVKGQSIPVEIWQIVDYADLSVTLWNTSLFNIDKQRLQEELDYYHSGIEAYQDARFEEALTIFKDIENNWPDKTNKNVYNMYIKRCEHYIDEPPGNDFNGVFVHKTKG